MGYRSVRWALLAMLLMLGFAAVWPRIEYRLYAATTPRPVDARGDLADYERSTIAIFERVSRTPSLAATRPNRRASIRPGVDASRPTRHFPAVR